MYTEFYGLKEKPFALLPDLTIHRIYNGWYFVGRPTPEELRQCVREMMRIVHEDFDFPGN